MSVGNSAQRAADASPSKASRFRPKALSPTQALALLEGFGDGLCVLNRDWRFIFVNRAAAAYWHTTHQDLLGRRIWDALPQAVGSHCHHMMQRALAEQRSMESETVSPYTGAWIRITVQPFEGGLAAIFRPIGARKEAEHRLRRALEELTEADAAKSRKMTVAAHDLRQPLHVILSAAELIRKRAGDPQIQRFLANVDLAVGQLTKGLDELLHAAKLEGRELQPRRQVLRLAEILEAVGRQWRPEAERKGLRLATVATSAEAESDPDMLRTILDNLVGNAIKYTTAGGVLIGCRPRGRSIHVQVVDSGSGIPADSLEAIFDEFYRLDAAHGQGLGLGLAIVRQTAALLDHPVIVKSQPGKGSNFTVVLPLPRSR
ncbi:MAG TPA: PAS domain-containing sensor histidine kinase [Alphaproteobacteria bacterium]|nr:PAS domain-containing sensor histidine kinase [Alphaproteobacteria bacterium]